MAFATDIHGPHTGVIEHIVTAARSTVSAVVNFRSARKSMTIPSGLTAREMNNFMLNGNNIERLALKIGFGV